MQWRIVVSLLALAPAIALALRDGKLQPVELEELAERLLAALLELVARKP